MVSALFHRATIINDVAYVRSNCGEMSAQNVCVTKLFANLSIISDCTAAVTCPALALRVVSSSVTSVGTMVNVSCPAGQKLQTGHDWTKTLCTRSGEWSPQIPDCVGKLYTIRCIVHFSRLLLWSPLSLLCSIN